LVSAQTGSGKIVAHGIVIAQTLLGDAPALPTSDAPLALVVARTREQRWIFGN
jgi:ATP-dependent RNA helicase DeaD